MRQLTYANERTRQLALTARRKRQFTSRDKWSRQLTPTVRRIGQLTPADGWTRHSHPLPNISDKSHILSDGPDNSHPLPDKSDNSLTVRGVGQLTLNAKRTGRLRPLPCGPSLTSTARRIRQLSFTDGVDHVENETGLNAGTA